jgi:hypothetical protein
MKSQWIVFSFVALAALTLSSLVWAQDAAWYTGDIHVHSNGYDGKGRTDVGRYDVFEETFTLDSSMYDNPWEDVQVTVTFTTPSGDEVEVGGFYYEPDTWKVRLVPWEVGAWSWRAVITDGARTVERIGEFACIESGQSGFVRRHPENPFRLVFDDGSLYPALGIGDCVMGSPLGNTWGFDGGFREGHEAGWTTDIDTYLSAYRAAGFNLFRWSIDNCAFKLWERIAPEGNRYLEREGKWGDQLVGKLRQYDFRVYLVLFGFNPAFAQEAGDSARMDAVRRYAKYVVDRYGAYADFWELMNEARAADNWYRLVAEYIRSIDPYGHMISTSWERPDLPVIEINSPHWYERENEFRSDLRAAEQINSRKHNGKPIIFGEQGNSVQNWDERSALRMRLRTWSAFFNEGVLIFWNTSFARDYRSGAANLYLGPEERQYIYALQNFTRDVDPDAAIAPVTVSNPARVRGYGLRSSGSFAAYLHNFTDHDNPTTNISITVDLPVDGFALWYDTVSGRIIRIDTVSAGRQTSRVPEFITDIALKVAGF